MLLYSLNKQKEKLYATTQTTNTKKKNRILPSKLSEVNAGVHL